MFAISNHDNVLTIIIVIAIIGIIIIYIITLYLYQGHHVTITIIIFLLPARFYTIYIVHRSNVINILFILISIMLPLFSRLL